MIGRSLITASISVTRVCSAVRVILALPRTLLMTVFVMPISRSQKPTYQGALLGMNSHSTARLANSCFSEGDWNGCSSSCATDRYVDAFSDIILLGRDFRLAKRRTAWMNISSVRSLTTSRCIARETAHVNKQM